VLSAAVRARDFRYIKESLPPPALSTGEVYPRRPSSPASDANRTPCVPMHIIGIGPMH